MTKDTFDRLLQIFSEAEDKEHAAAAMLEMLRLFEPELIKILERENCDD